MTLTMETILKDAARGDQDAWRQLIEMYSGRVYGVLFKQCRNAELSEEITQITFVKIVTKLADYQEKGRFESWLFRIAMNQLRDEMRRRKRHASSMDFSETPPETIGYEGEHEKPTDRMIQDENIDQLKMAIEELPEADREVLYLRYTGGLGFQEIADTLEQPLGTVLARSHRALKKLQTRLTPAITEEN